MREQPWAAGWRQFGRADAGDRQISQEAREDHCKCFRSIINYGRWGVIWNNCEDADHEGDSRILTCVQGTAQGELRIAAVPESPSHRVYCWDILPLLRSSCLHMENQSAGGGKEAETGALGNPGQVWD